MANFYIDPDTGSGTGVGSEADPFAAWSEATFAAGNSYFQKRGTTVTETVTVDVTGTSGSHVVLGAYDTGADPIINGSASRTHGLILDTVSYVDVSDLRITNATQKGIQIKGGFAAGSSNITITDCVADTIPGTADAIGNGVGITVDNINETTRECDNITFTRCTAHTCGRMGFDTQTSGTNIRWIDCVAYNNGASYDGGGFYAHPYRNAVTSGWTVVSGDVYRRDGLSANDDVQIVYWVEDGSFLTETASTTPAAGEFYYLKAGGPGSGEFRVNLGVDPDGQTLQYARGPQSNFKWINCTAYNNRQENGNDHGTGIHMDDLISNSEVSGCTAYDNEGPGIMMFRGQSNTISGSTAYGNGKETNVDHGIIANQQEASTITNCVVSDSGASGIQVGVGTTSVANCITQDNAAYGILVITGTCNSSDTFILNNTDATNTTLGGTLNQTNNQIVASPVDTTNQAFGKNSGIYRIVIGSVSSDGVFSGNIPKEGYVAGISTLDISSSVTDKLYADKISGVNKCISVYIDSSGDISPPDIPEEGFVPGLYRVTTGAYTPKEGFTNIQADIGSINNGEWTSL